MLIHTTSKRTVGIGGIVLDETIYIKMRQRLQVSPDYRLKLKDVAQISASEHTRISLQDLPVYEITKADKTHVVIDAMIILAAIHSYSKQYDVNLIGPSQTIVEILYDRKASNPIFFVAVWLLLFVGAGLAIIYFHEDVSMQQVHARLYYMITGEVNTKPLIMQIPYSVGLGLGMILFFNHLFKKRINEEPSPLEVEMFQYQQSLDQYVMMNQNKESMKKIENP